MKESLINLRQNAKDLYKSLASVYCPYFSEEIHYCSIIPNWRTRKSKEAEQKYINHTGNMAED